MGFNFDLSPFEWRGIDFLLPCDSSVRGARVLGDERKRLHLIGPNYGVAGLGFRVILG